VFSGFVLRGKPKDSTISNEFKKYCFRSNIVRKQIISTSSYTTRALTNGTLLSRVLFPLPPLPEQQAIAEVLSDTDSLIQSLEKLIAKKRLIKQGAMQELFTPRDGWTMKKLGDLFEITSSKRVFQSEWRDKGIPFYRARELAVLGEIGAIDNDLFITRSMYESFRKVYGVPKIGDMLVTGVGTLGKVYVVRDNHEFYFKDGNIIWFKINGSISTEYLRQLFLTPHIINQIENSSAGTTVGTYTISGAKKTVIPLPSTLKEQEYIADVLWSMDTEITALRKKLMKFRKLKQGLMQNLLTGKIRLV
jgi:type I restriction enzyme S subunit